MQINYEDNISLGELQFTQTAQIKCIISSHFYSKF